MRCRKQERPYKIGFVLFLYVILYVLYKSCTFVAGKAKSAGGGVQKGQSLQHSSFSTRPQGKRLYLDHGALLEQLQGKKTAAVAQ